MRIKYYYTRREICDMAAARPHDAALAEAARPEPIQFGAEEWRLTLATLVMALFFAALFAADALVLAKMLMKGM